MGEIVYFLGYQTISENPLAFGNESTRPNEKPFTSKELINQYEWVKSQIDQLGALNENWDGQGALRVFSEVIKTADQLTTIIWVDGISDIFPNPHGTLTIEWSNHKKEKLSLEIGVNTYSYFVKNSDNKPKLVDGKNILVDTQTLTKDLGELFSEEILNFIL